MKVLFAVHQFFPHHYTGTERVVLNLCRQLQRMGHDVIVLTYAIDSAEGLYPRGAFLVGKYSFKGIPVIAVRHREPPSVHGRGPAPAAFPDPKSAVKRACVPEIRSERHCR